MLAALLCAWPLLGLVVAGGCASYQFGTRSLFRSDIRTVHVPVVRVDSGTFRHDLGVRLTEAVQREVERRTPYKVTGDPLADSVLTCRIATDAKRVMTETVTDEPRALEAVLTVEASWIDRQGQVIMQNRVLPPGALTLMFTQGDRFVPEAGQSYATASQQAIDDLAERIVDQMEFRW